ncbi:DMT family transporter [Chelativorans sp. M5D2P16]|uniref:DMT family transporter n=1 Tax=Chelativorans sp. M5D2P16 TaxID=3095678 RepID=UPI002ACA15DC|nr:DMT family transporter [Chelativorans sp. M5D2P16]MDZ5696424.1 DMT family transporter [Chelativorans sp. M5D2P16]
MTVSSEPTEGAAGSTQAILVMCAGVLCLVLNDSLAKWLMDHYAPLQIIFLRNLIALPLVTIMVVSVAGRAALPTRHPGLHLMRGAFSVFAALCFFLSIRALPLAEATSLIFAAPLFITALSVPLLREHVGLRRWTAVIVGFIGVLIIVRPGAATFQTASLLVLCAAMLYALMMISARWIARDESVWTTMFYIVLFPMLISGGLSWTEWQTPSLAHLPFFVAIAIVGSAGIVLITQAFRLAPAAIVAPFDYTALLWASLIGWLVWSEVPDGWTYAGAAVIIASGIYIVFRETRRPGTPVRPERISARSE